MIYSEFRCPKCDSTHFSGLPVRSCNGVRINTHDGKMESCDFQWPMEDDWKYERFVVRRDGPDDEIPGGIIDQVVLASRPSRSTRPQDLIRTFSMRSEESQSEARSEGRMAIESSTPGGTAR